MQTDFDFLEIRLQQTSGSRKRAKSLNCAALNKTDQIREIVWSIVDDEHHRSKSPLGSIRPAPSAGNGCRRTSNPCHSSVKLAQIKRRSVPLLDVDECSSQYYAPSTTESDTDAGCKHQDFQIPLFLLETGDVHLPESLDKKVIPM